MAVQKSKHYKMMQSTKRSSKDIEDIHIVQHVFENGRCQPDSKVSLCGKVKVVDVEGYPGATCLTEDGMRRKAEEFGRKVCGQCVAVLYKSED